MSYVENVEIIDCHPFTLFGAALFGFFHQAAMLVPERLSQRQLWTSRLPLKVGWYRLRQWSAFWDFES